MRIGVLALVVCAGLTLQRLPAWHSNLTLWQAAVEVTPSRPRPILNLAAALAEAGDYDRAAWWSIRGLWLSDAPARRYERAAVKEIVRQQLQWIETRYPVCHQPPFSLGC